MKQAFACLLLTVVLVTLLFAHPPRDTPASDLLVKAGGDWCDVPPYRPDPLERPPVLRGLPNPGRNA